VKAEISPTVRKKHRMDERSHGERERLQTPLSKVAGKQDRPPGESWRGGDKHLTKGERKMEVLFEAILASILIQSLIFIRVATQGHKRKV